MVSCANHHEVPGKKAWTWGQGGFGKMHQMDLTDHDGPYNEVQTGPLLTQGQVGRLEPCQAVEWTEWWYPIHGIGGFSFANNNLAVNEVSAESGQIGLRLLGTATWPDAVVKLAKDGRQIDAARCQVSPRQPAEVRLATHGQGDLEVEITAAGLQLAAFRLPLLLPVRQRPEKNVKPPETASELVRAGWQDFLFARFPEAEARFKKALEQDAGNPEAYTGLAHLNLDRDPAAAASAARSALAIDPDHGGARYALAVAEYRLGHETAALEEAWKATRDSAVAVAARALVAKLDLRRHDYSGAIAAVSGDGPWREDPTCRNRLALAWLRSARETTAAPRAGKSDQSALRRAASLAGENLEVDPLDPLARDIRWRTGADSRSKLRLSAPNEADRHDILNLLAEYSELGDLGAGATLNIFPDRQASLAHQRGPDPVACYWLAYLTQLQEPAPATGSALSPAVRRYLSQARASALESAAAYQPEAPQAPLLWDPSPPALDPAFPYQREALPALRWANAAEPADGTAALYLGHLLFHLGRYAEARDLWKQAAELGAQPVIAWRALGMAAKTLDGDLNAARQWLEKAAQANPKDAIVARDLATVLFDLADKAASDSDKHGLFIEARDHLQASFDTGKGRSDFITLLGRAQNRLGAFAETARMLDGVRVTVWEGAHEVHDLFEQAHLALGEAQLKAGRAAEALAQFDRALDYPENLATGKLENAPEAHIQYRRGNALAALGRQDQAVAAWKLAAAEPPSKDSRIEEARQKAKKALDQSGR